MKDLTEAAREFCVWKSYFDVGQGVNQVAAFTKIQIDKALAQSHSQLQEENEKMKGRWREYPNQKPVEAQWSQSVLLGNTGDH